MKTVITLTNLHLDLIEKLGWKDMALEVSIPAINQIIYNYTELQKRAHVTLEFSEAVEQLLVLRSSTIFLYLNDWNVYDDPAQFDLFCSLKKEIEYLMYHGVSFDVAISEWYK